MLGLVLGLGLANPYPNPNPNPNLNPNPNPNPNPDPNLIDQVGDFLEERRYQVARRLDAIKRQLGSWEGEGEDAATTQDEEGF